MDFAWMRQATDAVNALRHIELVQGNKQTGQVHVSDGNTVIELPASGPQGFQIVSDCGDYYQCNPFNGVTASSTIVKVAKHQDIRCILASATIPGGAWLTKTIRGITYTYTYNPIAGTTADGINVIEYTRSVVGSDSSSETDYITPCLNVGDIITAEPASFSGPTTLVGVTWQAWADGRAWAAQP